MNNEELEKRLTRIETAINNLIELIANNTSHCFVYDDNGENCHSGYYCYGCLEDGVWGDGAYDSIPVYLEDD